MRCAMPPSTPCCTHAPSRLTSCISQLCVASGMAPKISAAVLSHRLHRLISHRPMSHRLIVSSSHRRIVASFHCRHIVASSHCRHIVASSHHLIVAYYTPSHRRIVSSSHHPIVAHHQQCLIVSSSLRLIFSSSHPRTPSIMPHRLIVSSTHRLIDSPSHRLSFASSHRRTPSTMPHRLAPGRLVVWSCPVLCVCARGGRARMCSRACRPAQLAVADDAHLCCDGRRERGSRRPAARLGGAMRRSRARANKRVCLPLGNYFSWW